MADDDKKLENGEADENKDWQWDASAPTVSDDFEILLRDSEDETDDDADDETEIAADEAVKNIGETDEDVKPAVRKDSKKDAEDSDDEDSDVPPGHCLICGQKIRNSQSEFYCNECRTKYMKVDYGATHIILSIIMVLVAIIGIVTFVSTSKITAAVRKGDELVKKGNYSAAYDAYYAVDEETGKLNEGFRAFLGGISNSLNDTDFELFSSGSNTGKKKAVVIAKSFSVSKDNPDDFFAIVDSSFTKKELDKPEYAQVKGCYDYLKHLIDANTFLNNKIIKEFQDLYLSVSSGEAANEEIAEKRDKIITGIDNAAKERKDITKADAAFVKYALLDYIGQSFGVPVEEDVLYKYISEAYDNAGDYSYIFFNDIASCSVYNENYEKVISAADKMLKSDPSCFDAYYYKAFAYNNLGKFDEALETCDKLGEYSEDVYAVSDIKAAALRRKGSFAAAIDVCENVPKNQKYAEILRQEAIAYYLSNDEDNALKYAREAFDSAIAESYSSSNLDLRIANTCALIYKLCKADEDYDAIVESLGQQGGQLEDSVMSVINGETTFEDMFMKGKGDI